MNSNPEILNQYSNYLSSLQNRSPRTVEQYLIDLTMYTRFLMARERSLVQDSDEALALDLSAADIGLYEAVTPEIILEFITYTANERQNKARTRSRKLSAIKSFYKYLTNTRHLIEDNPAAAVDAPKKGSKQLPKFLTLEESIALLDAVRTDSESKTRERDYAILTLFLNTGMRLSELVSIDITRIDRDMQSLMVIGKGSKERVIYLNDACRSALTAWLLVRQTLEINPSHKNALFISSRRTRISIKTVQWMVYKYLNMAGLGSKKCSVHKLRHTAATLMYQTGQVDVRVLKDILGHEQLNTTQIYTHLSDKQMEDAVKANPLSEIKAPSADLKSNSKDEPADEDNQ